MAKDPADRTYRLGVLSRSVAGILGGYALASFSSLALALGLPFEKPDAINLGVMIGFILFAVAVIWAFSCRSAVRAWIGITAVTTPFLIITLLLNGWVS